MYMIVILLLAAIIGMASVYITKKDNNLVEEICEEVIEKELNLPEHSINLTPKDIKDRFA